jgi:hypothetical protein
VISARGADRPKLAILTVVAALKAILEQALQLSDDERRELIGQLLRSLEPVDEKDRSAVERVAAWSGELDRRAREIHDGAEELIDGDQALARVRRSVPARRP